MRKSKRTESSTKSDADAAHGAASVLPKKVRAAIKDVSVKDAQKNPPVELKRMIDKISQNVGKDFITDHNRTFAPLRKRFKTESRDCSVQESFEQTGKILNDIMVNNSTFSATLPVVLERFDTQRSELIGSGVLLRILDYTFLLTAAHVTDFQKNGTITIPGKRGFMPMNGKCFSTRLPISGGREDDTLDVAFCLLDKDCTAALDSRCTVLERRSVSLQSEPERRTNYTFAGYPWRKSKAPVGRVETTVETFTGMEAKASEYKAMGLTRSRHVAIRFRRRKSFLQRTGKVVTAPLPHGMSGGGVYAWTEEALSSWPVQLPLAGIANAYIPEKSLLVGTRLHVYVACIFHCVPELGAIAG